MVFFHWFKSTQSWGEKQVSNIENWNKVYHTVCKGHKKGLEKSDVQYLHRDK